MFNFVRYRKIYYIFSGTLVLACLMSLLIFGLNPGIDFSGGTILEVKFLGTRPSVPQLRESLNGLDLGEIYIQPIGESNMLFRLKDIDEAKHQQILEKLKESGKTTPAPVAEFLEEELGPEKAEETLGGKNAQTSVQELRFESIGPVIGQELAQKTKWMLLLTLVLILIYVAWAFRKVPRSWQYGIIAVLTLFHDVSIPLGVFSILGKFYGAQLTIPIITALLTVLGYSVNDTVVIFDRLRENFLKGKGIDFEEAVNKALNQTIGRSLGTSLTTLFVLFAIFFLGGETLRDFSLALILGLAFGSYSSIFLAAPLLVTWRKWRERRI
jgi:preprotein translocase subunit SecF